jgi:hypothetical protein
VDGPEQAQHDRGTTRLVCVRRQQVRDDAAVAGVLGGPRHQCGVQRRAQAPARVALERDLVGQVFAGGGVDQSGIPS